jgi:hypothetical protein
LVDGVVVICFSFQDACEGVADPLVFKNATAGHEKETFGGLIRPQT